MKKMNSGKPKKHPQISVMPKIRSIKTWAQPKRRKWRKFAHRHKDHLTRGETGCVLDRKTTWDGCVVRQLLLIKTTETVKKKIHPPPNLWLKTSKDQLDPTRWLISPSGNPEPHYRVFAIHSPAEHPKSPRLETESPRRTRNGTWSPSEKSPPLSPRKISNIPPPYEILPPHQLNKPQ